MHSVCVPDAFGFQIAPNAFGAIPDAFGFEMHLGRNIYTAQLILFFRPVHNGKDGVHG